MRLKPKILAERIFELNKNIENLIRVHYQFIDMLLPEARPTKQKIEIFKKRKREAVISFKELKKKL